MMDCRPSLLLCIFLLCLAIDFNGSVLAHAVSQEEQNSSIRLELIHRHNPELIAQVHGEAWPKLTAAERIKELVQDDMIRHRIISLKRGQSPNTGRRNLGASVQMPMQSGSDYGKGQYFVHIKVGKPEQQFMLIADTGSDLTWVNCKYRCGANCGTQRGRKNPPGMLLADRSSSFRPIPCSTRMCKVGLADLASSPKCPRPGNPCGYEFSYYDGSAALGFFANDTVTLDLTNRRKMNLPNTLIGCTQSTKGTSFDGANGVLGLGYANHAFAKTAAAEFGGKFSYCLVDHLSPKNISNYLTFGGNRNQRVVGKMRQTELLLGAIPPLYTIKISGISIGRALLKIPPRVWDVNSGGGAILDSGTSLTLLVAPAYKPVMTALEPSVSSYRRLFKDVEPFEYCFNSTGFKPTLVPRLTFHFADGARFQPPVKSYIIDIAPQTKCLGFLSINWPGTSIIGNIMQQNHLWEFDLARRKVGFAPSSCT